MEEVHEKVEKKLQRRERRAQSNPSLLGKNDLVNVKTETNKFGEKITIVDGDIPVNLPIANNDRFLFIIYDQSAYTHGLHKYPAKFFL